MQRSLEPGAPVDAIALDAGINANLLFTWRREHRDAMAKAPAALLPVKVEEPAPLAPAFTAPRSPTGTIEIDIGRAHVRLRGVVDDDNVRCVLRTVSTLA